jgi:prepilin-type N-terminal cleavage/methylation domain-containing protein
MTRFDGESQQGFSLIEVILVLAVLAVLAATFAPSLLQQVVESRVDSTRIEERAIYEAMVGRADDSSSFGFVGDLGRLPASFVELLDGTGLPVHTTATVRSVGMGWNGPYLNQGQSAADMLKDAFGRPYTGAELGRVISAGPDGIVGNPDDIAYPPVAPVVTGRVQVTIKRFLDPITSIDSPSYAVNLYYSDNGIEAVLTATVPPFIFENVPMGLHAVQVVSQKEASFGTIVAQDTIATPGFGRTKLVELWLKIQ